MENVHLINTYDKAKMFYIGAAWDYDNAASTPSYVLDNIETFISPFQRIPKKTDNISE